MFLYNLTRNYGLSWISQFFGSTPDDRNFLSNSPTSDDKEDSTVTQAELEQIASDFMVNEEWKGFGIVQEVSEDLPSQERPVDDDYYSSVERERYELPKPSLKENEQVHWCIRWQKGSCLGRGAFGSVHLGLNLDNGELLAVKQVTIPGEDLHNNREVQALQQEINILRTLEHENIVRYLGSSIEGSSFNIFLEYVPGGSIASVIKKFGTLNDNLIRLYTKQILQGLEYLHSRQIIHRDIKGANILADNKGVIKLSDFGASKKLEGLVAQTGTGCHSLKGTVYWMAPEVIKQAGYGRQADIWSLGCTVVEMATGKPPWITECPEQVSAMYAIATSNETPAIPSTLPPACQDFLSLCFRRDPRARPNAKKLLSHPWITGTSPFPSPIISSLPSPTFFAGPTGDLFEMIQANSNNNHNNHNNPNMINHINNISSSGNFVPSLASSPSKSFGSHHANNISHSSHSTTQQQPNSPTMWTSPKIHHTVPQLRLPPEKFKKSPTSSISSTSSSQSNTLNNMTATTAATTTAQTASTAAAAVAPATTIYQESARKLSASQSPRRSSGNSVISNKLDDGYDDDEDEHTTKETDVLESDYSNSNSYINEESSNDDKKHEDEQQQVGLGERQQQRQEEGEDDDEDGLTSSFRCYTSEDESTDQDEEGHDNQHQQQRKQQQQQQQQQEEGPRTGGKKSNSRNNSNLSTPVESPSTPVFAPEAPFSNTNNNTKGIINMNSNNTIKNRSNDRNIRNGERSNIYNERKRKSDDSYNIIHNELQNSLNPKQQQQQGQQQQQQQRQQQRQNPLLRASKQNPIKSITFDFEDLEESPDIPSHVEDSQ